MEIIKNLALIYYLNDEQKSVIEQQAQAHLRFSNISFNVLQVDEDSLSVQTIQGKHLSENYADEQRLIEITQNTFADVLLGRSLTIEVIPYVSQ